MVKILLEKEQNARKIFSIINIYFTGALLFGSINNRVNNRAHQRLYDLPPPHGVRPLPLRKRRLRGKGQKFRKRRLRNRRPVVGGRRRLRKNMNVRRRPGAAVFQPNYNLDYINNHRIQVNLYVATET